MADRPQSSVPLASKPDCPAPMRGIVVALVGPDGVGKTTQTARLTMILQRTFPCSAVYLGSGDGGWKGRQGVKRLLRMLRLRPASRKAARNAPARERVNDSLVTALSGLCIALERYVALRRAMSLAASGSIVISDRWPQVLHAGSFDGPLRLHSKASPIVQHLSRIEHRLYHRMERYKPDLTIHLVSDFEISTVRKPGDRSRAEFQQRLALMDEMRRLDPRIMVVDANETFEQVTRDLLGGVRRAVADQHSPQQSHENIYSLLFLIVIACLGIIELGAA